MPIITDLDSVSVEVQFGDDRFVQIGKFGSVDFISVREPFNHACIPVSGYGVAKAMRDALNEYLKEPNSEG